MTVVTRFAPSPTGSLHIGGARTALFNYLFARNQKGRCLLRIEDTDRERSRNEHVDQIIDDLHDLNIVFDGDIVVQSNNIARHREVAELLVGRGLAYRDYVELSAIEEMREQWKVAGNKGPFRYESPYRNAMIINNDLPYVVRLKMPREGSTTIDDLVQGSVTVSNSELDDMVLLRTDGTPTYMLSVVVDDHDMGVTHVIRGDDHLNNAFRQLQIYKAMGWNLPTYGHIPLIHDMDGKKLSKRNPDQAITVSDFIKMGYPPSAIQGYLSQLGAPAFDDPRDINQLIKDFDISKVRRAPAKFDYVKLARTVKSYYQSTVDIIKYGIIDDISSLDEDTLIDNPTELQRKSIDFLIKSVGEKYNVTKYREAFELAKSRSNSYLDMIEYLSVFVGVDTKSQFELVGSLNPNVISAMIELIKSSKMSTINYANLVEVVMTANGATKKEVLTTLRIALSGKAVSLPIVEVMSILDKNEIVERLMAAQVTIKNAGFLA